MNIESNPYQSPESSPLNNGLDSTEASEVNNRKSASDMFRLGIIATEVFPPTSGFIRYGALATTELYTTNPVVGAAVLGLTTLGLEWGSYRAALGWIVENKIGDMVDVVRDKVDQYRNGIDEFKSSLNVKSSKLKPGRFVPNIPKVPNSPEHGATLPLIAQSVIGIELGTVVLLGVKQEMDRSRGIDVNKRDARVAIAAISGVLAVQGAAISAGVEFIKKDTEMGLSVLGISAVTYATWKIIQKRIKERRNKVNHER